VLRPAALLALPLAAAVLVLTGCGPAQQDNANDGVIRIVASTNVYGDIAQTVAGENAEVTSIIDDAGQDPHEFEANGRVQLALSRADIVIVNGGGYDDFATTLLQASGNEDAIVITAVELSGLDPETDGFNEHVWYDYPTMEALTGRIASELQRINPPSTGFYAATSAALLEDLYGLEQHAETVAQTDPGATAIVTEPVPGYLLRITRVNDITPPEFSEAIEEDADVPPALLQSVLNLVGDGSVSVVLYNEQTGGPQTDAVIDIATENRVPAIGVTETLPAGLSYVEWQQQILDALQKALRG
jgi:zinc/manganese transport system substrate-binding protein